MAKYIDADILPKLFDEEYKKTIKLIEDGETHLDNLAEGFSEAARVVTFVALTTADAVEVVRCKDCRYFSEIQHCGVLGFCEPNDYCSRGERRKE